MGSNLVIGHAIDGLGARRRGPAWRWVGSLSGASWPRGVLRAHVYRGTRSSHRGGDHGPKSKPRPGVRIREGATLDGIHLSRTGARAVWDRVGPSIVEALSGQ